MTIIKGIPIEGSGTADELAAYVERGLEIHGDKLLGIDCTEADDGYVVLDYRLRGVRFERIRRITGYLVGSVERFNDAKRAEERERVKHG